MADVEIRSKLSDGKIVLDLGDALSSLSLREKIEVALHLACSQDVFSAVVDLLIEDYTDPLLHGHWTTNDITPQRMRILQKLDALRVAAVKDYMNEAQRQKETAERETAHVWRMIGGWPRECPNCHHYVPRPSAPEWKSSPYATEAEAVAALADADAKVEAAGEVNG